MRTIRPFSLLSIFAAATLATACVEADDTLDDSLDEEIAEAGVRPTFDLWRADNGQYYFHLVASNGETLLASEGYQSRTGALGGLLSVLDNGGIASRYAMVVGADQQYYLKLRAANQQLIATSEGYATKSSATRAINASTRAVGAYLQYWATTTGARAQVFEGESGQFRFNVYAANGQSMLRSEAYTTEAAALNGAFSVQENGRNPVRYVVLAASNGQYYFNLRAANNQIIGTSELYATKASAERGRDALIALIPSIELL